MTRAALSRVLRRIGWALVVIFGVATLSFVVAQVLPGDPARMMLGPQAPPADVAHVRERTHVALEIARIEARGGGWIDLPGLTSIEGRQDAGRLTLGAFAGSAYGIVGCNDDVGLAYIGQIKVIAN